MGCSPEPGRSVLAVEGHGTTCRLHLATLPAGEKQPLPQTRPAETNSGPTINDPAKKAKESWNVASRGCSYELHIHMASLVQALSFKVVVANAEVAEGSLFIWVLLPVPTVRATSFPIQLSLTFLFRTLFASCSICSCKR